MNTHIVLIRVIVTKLIFGLLNDSKIGLKIVKKNPVSTVIKNLKNFNILFQKVSIE